MSEKRKEINALILNEKATDVSLDIFASAQAGNPHENRLARVIRWATLNGHLLPKIFFKRGYVWQDKGYAHLREIYRFKKVLYIHKPSNKGFIVEHNKGKFFTHLFKYIKDIYNLSMNYSKLKKEYQNSYDDLTSQNFWRKQFKKD